MMGALFLFQPAGVTAQAIPITTAAPAITQPTINPEKTVATMQNIADQTVAFIDSAVLRSETPQAARSKILSARYKALNAVTEQANEYKARFDRFLLIGGPNEVDAATKATIKSSILQVNFAMQEAIDTIEQAIKEATDPLAKSAYQAPENPVSPIKRTALPESYAAGFNQNQPVQAPSFTNSYYRSGGAPLLPLVPNLTKPVYNLRPPVQNQGFSNPFANFGATLGGFLGFQNLFQSKASIRISRYIANDPTNYSISFYDDRGQLKLGPLTAPTQGTQPSAVQKIEPGRYEVLYQADGGPTINLPAGISENPNIPPPNVPLQINASGRFSLTINSGETWCLEVPLQPTPCL